MFIVVSYDIVDDRRRAKVLKLMKNFGTHTQYSVFECNLQAKQLRDLKRRMRAIVDEKLDQVRFYPLSADDVRAIEVMGEGTPAEDPLVYWL